LREIHNARFTIAGERKIIAQSFGFRGAHRYRKMFWLADRAGRRTSEFANDDAGTCDNPVVNKP
jgi:hypothetical protein